MIKPGFAYIFEGNEGCGKTTVINNLAKKLRNSGYDVVVTREPGGSELAEKIRNIIMNEDSDSSVQLMLFLAARLDHYNKVILPAIHENKIVLIDRFIDSTLVYQGMLKDEAVNIRMIYKFNQIYFGGLFPGCVKKCIYLRLNDVTEGLNRIRKNRRETNKFDNQSIEIHKKIQQSYDKLYHENFNTDKVRVIVNASQDIEDVMYDVLKVMQEV